MPASTVPLTSRTKRQVFGLTLEDSRQLALKLDTRPENGRIRKEFAILKSLHPHFAGSSKNAVIEPVYIAPDAQFHITGMVPQKTAKEIIYRTDSLSQAGQVYRRAGSWLNVLHSFHPPARTAFWGNWMLEELQATCSATAPETAPEIYLPYIRTLETQIASLNGTEDSLAYSHGDFHGGNLIMGRGVTFGLDFTETHSKLAVYDAVDFLKSDIFRPACPEDLAANGIRQHSLDMFFRLYSLPLNPDILDVCLRGRLLIDWLKTSKQTYARSKFHQKKHGLLATRLQRAFAA